MSEYDLPILEAPPASGHRISILLVEDNPIDAEMVIRALKKNDLLHAVHWAKNGEDALDFLFCNGTYSYRQGQEPPKLILLDIKMPKISGIEVLQKIREDAALRLASVVIISSSSEHPDIEQACRLGVNSYIIKSIDFNVFADKVAKVINRFLPQLTVTRPHPIGNDSARLNRSATL